MAGGGRARLELERPLPFPEEVMAALGQLLRLRAGSLRAESCWSGCQAMRETLPHTPMTSTAATQRLTTTENTAAPGATPTPAPSTAATPSPRTEATPSPSTGATAASVTSPAASSESSEGFQWPLGPLGPCLLIVMGITMLALMQSVFYPRPFCLMSEVKQSQVWVLCGVG